MPAARKKTTRKKTARTKASKASPARTTTKKSAARKKATKKAGARRGAPGVTVTKTGRVKPVARIVKGQVWTKAKVMAELQFCGTSQNRKVYARHGATGDMFGVSFANLELLRKAIKQDHDLAMALWETGNIDAMTLAPMICDPSRFTKADLDRMVKQTRYYMVACYFARAAAKSAHARACAKKWCAAKNEMTKRVGYDVLSSLVKNDSSLTKGDLLRELKTIEKEIHSAPNRAKEGMNFTLIAMGVYRDDIHKDVMAAAKRIGFVGIDHGETSCKDFKALEEIPKARAHLKKKAASRKR